VFSDAARLPTLGGWPLAQCNTLAIHTKNVEFTQPRKSVTDIAVAARGRSARGRSAKQGDERSTRAPLCAYPRLIITLCETTHTWPPRLCRDTAAPRGMAAFGPTANFCGCNNCSAVSRTADRICLMRAFRSVTRCGPHRPTQKQTRTIQRAWLGTNEPFF
jgi:hypothetical protein